MALTTEQIAAEYPIPSYRFVVAIDDDKIPFSSVSGLDIKYGTMQYQDGIGNFFQMPGQREPVTITLRKGIFRGPNALYDWINSISLNKVVKRDIMISLTDATGSNYLVTWNVADAFPTALSSPSLDASSNEVSIQEVTLVADRVSIQTY
ncbi:phage tail protein [Dyella choica]|uniref:Phage tail protein n=1 Tax=Dyella choica TaxID=1927959 RepID=A0A432MB07_9GAMM|nr:phage tail protein [Dyella choica]RUL78810.1 phage tail protein [Dyella choica]